MSDQIIPHQFFCHPAFHNVTILKSCIDVTADCILNPKQCDIPGSACCDLADHNAGVYGTGKKKT